MDKKFEVTLAKKVEDYELFSDTQRYFMQPKLDGVRCYINKDGAFSRNHKPFKNVDHILEELAPFFRYAPEITLDGELYTHDLSDDFNKIISLVRKTVNITEEQREESRKMIQFHCYDLFNEHRPKDWYGERNVTIQHIVDYKYDLKYTQTVPTKIVYNEETINKFHKENKELGYEGSMLRKDGLPYEQRRSAGLLKVKDWHDTEGIITDYVEGKGKFEGGLGKFIVVDEDDREVEVPWPNLTIIERQMAWKDRENYIGKKLTFEYFERTPAGAYRFPRAKCVRNYY